MSIEEKIRELVSEKFPGFSYVFEDWGTADVVMERVDLPAIICVLPVVGRLVFKNGRVRDSENSAFAFVDKVERDANGEDNEAVYTRMKEVAGDFLSELMKCGFFEPLEDGVPYQTIYESLSVNVTGVFVELTLKEVIGRCL